MMLRKHENPDEVYDRRTRAAASAKHTFLKDVPQTTMNMTSGTSALAGEASPGDSTGANATGNLPAALSISALHPDFEKTTPLPFNGGTSTSPAGANETTARPGTPSNKAGGKTQEPLPTLKDQEEVLVNSITTAISNVLPLMQDQAQMPEDLVRLGMGLGISLQANGLLDAFKKKGAWGRAQLLDHFPNAPLTHRMCGRA
jgi:hypothetical protein